MLDIANETKPLDAIQVAALRKADRVAFFHRDKPDATGFTSYIEAIKSPSPTENDPFAKEAYVFIPCEFRVTDYTRGEKIPYGSDAFNAFEMVYSYNDEWKTTASLLRAGDKLCLHWQRGGWNTEAMENATPKFYGDKLCLLVTRGDSAELGKYGKNAKVLTFHVDTSICEDNSARMIRRA
jgi:hypothetical protein